MIGSLSEQIAKWLKSKKIIEAEDVDVCGYGIFWLLNIIEFLLVSVILGTWPLVVASGAGAVSRRSLGTAVFGGMLVSVVVGTLLIPVFYAVVQLMINKVAKRKI